MSHARMGDNASDNKPARGGKPNPREGGIRVPFAAQWPGKIPMDPIYQNPVIPLDITPILPM